MIETGGSLQPDVNQISAFHKTSLLHLSLWELLQSMVLKEKRAILGTGSESDPRPFSSFTRPVIQSLGLVYLYNFWTILVVGPAVQDVPVGTLM